MFYCTQAFKRNTDNVSSTELPAFFFEHTTKQTASCQPPDDGLQKCVRLFRYSCWLLIKFILGARRIFEYRCRMRRPKRGSFWFIKKASKFGALIIERHFGQVSLIKIYQFHVPGKPQKTKSRVFCKVIVPHNVVVNSIMPTTNEKQAWNSQR